MANDNNKEIASFATGLALPLPCFSLRRPGA